MAIKGQINFRIEESLLDQIKAQAESEGIGYTAWIIRQCKLGLGLISKDSKVYQLSSDSQVLDDRIVKKLERIEEVLEGLSCPLPQYLENQDALIELMGATAHNNELAITKCAEGIASLKERFMGQVIETMEVEPSPKKLAA